MKKIIYLFFAFVLLALLSACSLFKTTTKANTYITIGYVINGKKEYRTYDSYNVIEFMDYETETGYEFVGWSEEVDGNVVTKVDLKGKSEVTLYPITKPINYRIIYDLDGGKNNIDNPNTYTIEDEITIKAPTKENFAFNGWTTDTITTPTLNYVIEKGTYGDITLKANYINGKVSVTFYGYEELNQIIDYNTRCPKPDDPEKVGDTFLYWCADDSLQDEFDFDTLITKNITLYPLFSHTDFYKLTINNSEFVKSNHKNNDMLPKDAIITLNIDYIVEGYEFKGWNINSSLYSKVNEITLKMPDGNLVVDPILDSLTTYSFTKGTSDLLIDVSETNMDLFGANITTSDYSFTASKLKINASFLNTLDLGLHSFLYNSNTIIYVFVKPSETTVTNIKIDYDINYPLATLIFDEKEGLDYSYSLDGNSYIECNSYDTLTINNKFISHTLSVKCEDNITDYTIEAMPSAAQAYLEKTFTYQGNTYDYYIDSFDDLKTIIEYAAQAAYPSAGGTSYLLRFYYPYGNNKDKAGAEYKLITNKLMSVPYGLSYTYSYSSKEVDFTLSSNGTFNTRQTSQTKTDVTTTQFKPSSRSTTFDDFYIEQCSKTQEVRSIYELENLDYGIKPIITDTKTRLLYNKAKEILRTYVDDSFTVYEKLKAIYDYLGSYVTYDNELLEIETNQSDYQSFTAYAALVNGIAVCDGIASAFKLLCTIEGIECIEIIGCAKNVGHAWNKVKIGNVWYGVDATWSRGYFDDLTFIKHTYFLVDEVTLMNFGDSHHYEQATVNGGITGLNIDKTANNNLDYYDLMMYGSYDLVCNSKDEFNSMVAYFLLNDIKFVEIRLDGLSYSDVSSFTYDVYHTPGINNYVYLVRKTA